jgi:Pyruvate/2-oxoacid:ferredoxin oxidoreductase delta subunit
MEEKQEVLLSPNRRKEFVVTGQLVDLRDRNDADGSEQEEASPSSGGKHFSPPEILTIEELARTPIDGIDSSRVLSEMADVGPEARLFLYRPEGKTVRYEVFEDPRVCLDLHRGAVIENLKEKPKDVSGWRTHDFFIDLKGCLGDECGRCAIVCPESAIHLRGTGKGSFHEIDPLACKGCFICWVECFRTAADCILVDGKTFDPGMRAKHFGE